MEFRFDSVQDASARLHALGLFYPDATQGFQYDVVASFKPTGEGKVTQASLCGFNCTTKKGNYNCPAATTLNPGVSKSTFAPAKFILDKCDVVEQGLDLVRQWFVDSDLDSFCQETEITDPVFKAAIRASFERRLTEANLFGGDSEQHPQIVEIIRRLKERKMKVNLTATGGRWMNDQRYVDELLADPPQVICLSLDDLTEDEFTAYASMSAAELKNAFKTADREDWDYGQKKKAIAGLYVARILTDLPGKLPCGLLFNTVLHPGNISRINEITKTAEAAFPGLIVNPYPGQSSFLHEPATVDEDYFRALEHFVDHAIEKTKEGKRFVKRLHYWLVLKAAFNHYRYQSPEELGAALSGYGVWTCYQEPMAGFYVQPSRSEVPVAPLNVHLGKIVRREDVEGVPGGYLGCYWNPNTVTERSQIKTAQGVADHILHGMTELARKSHKPCPGSLMPRLMFNFVSTWKGLSRLLRPEVTRLRRLHAGF